ncbi:MAG TPA: hypothetical protein VD859_01130 [Nocardioides sp.]|nr:hypothetical protein [Nocardioides sp.]
MRQAVPLSALALVVATVGLGPAAGGAPEGDIELVSVGHDGSPINGAVGEVDVSASGRYVVYSSGADNIVENDLNSSFDVYLHDRRSGSTISLTPGADGSSSQPRVSADGSRVVFVSTADSLVPATADNISTPNVFVWSRDTGQVRQVDLDAAGEAPDSGGTTADISANGRHVAFTSLATDLVDRQVSGAQHVYVRDLANNRTRVLDPTADGDSSAPAIDADGDRVAFVSGADNLAPQQSASHDTVVVWRRGKPFRNLTPAPSRSSGSPAISGTGDKVAFTTAMPLRFADQDTDEDIYYADVRKGRTRLVSVGSEDGPDQSPSVSGDGRYVAFESSSDLALADSDGQLDGYVWAADRNQLRAVTGGAPGASGSPALSGTGAVVAFTSDDLAFVPGDNNSFFDVFIRQLDN